MARVFVAEERGLGRRVVLKLLPPEFSGTISVERFRREILVTASLQHPCIVPVLLAGEALGVPYYTMPYIEGASLHDRLLDRAELPVAEAVAILRDIAGALAYAHSGGVVHRDLKPDNVLLSGGYALVSDFGVAKALAIAGGGTLTSVGLALGTPAYMAPEQAAADPGADHRVDLYALGVVAYELLAPMTVAWLGAERAFQRAIALKPGYATAHHWYAHHLVARGRSAAAIDAIREAQRLDPLSVIIGSEHGWMLYAARQNDAAINQIRRTLEFDSSFAVGHYQLGMALARVGRFPEAIVEEESAVALSGGSTILVHGRDPHGASRRSRSRGT